MGLLILTCRSDTTTAGVHSPRHEPIIADRFIVYMQYPPLSSINEEEKDYIVLHGIGNANKRDLVKEFLNRSPRVSPNGRLVAFLSAREGDFGRLRALGELAPRQIYGYDLADDKITKLTSNFSLSQMGHLTSIQWDPNPNGLVCINSRNKIYFVRFGTDTVETLCDLDSVSWISSARVSPNGEHLVLSYGVQTESIDHEISVREGVALLNMKSKGVTHLRVDLTGIAGWTPDGDSFLSCDTTGTWGIYHLRSKAFFPLSLPNSLKNYEISDLQFWNNDTLIFIGEKGIASENEGPDDVYLFCMKNDRLITLTKDGNRKSDLTFYNKFRR